MKKHKSLDDPFNLNFITDNEGKKQFVVMKLEDYRELIEDYEDLLIAAERRDSESISFDEFEKKLKADGRL